jgi:hypothetical protein
MKLEELKESKRFKKVIWNNHHEKTLKSIENYIEDFKTISSIERLNNLIILLEHDYSIFNISKRIDNIKKLKRDSTSKKSFILRYGEIEGNKRWEKRNNRLKETSSRLYLEYKLGFEEADKILKNKCPNSEQILKNKYPNSWKNKLEEYKRNYSYANSESGYIEKYGEVKGREKWKERMQKRKISNSESGYIEKYGEVKGREKWKEKCEKHSYRMSKQYYIDTYGKILGEKICKENSIYGLIRKHKGEKFYLNFLDEKNKKQRKPIKEKFVEKYGEEDGVKKYKNYIEKQKYAHTLDYFVEKYGKENGHIQFKQHKKRIISNLIVIKKNKSLISLELFKALKENLNTDNVFYGSNEMFILNTEINKLYFYDFTYKNKIIEFHGDFWHMNPKKYSANEKNKQTNILAKDIWEHDKNKSILANKNGYDILIIWESDYKSDKTNTVLKCLNFLKNE